MKKVIETIKKNKVIGISLGIILLGILITSIMIYTRNKKKEYQVEEIKEIRYYQLTQNDKTGVIDEQGNTIVEAKYDSIKIPNPEKAIFLCEEQGKTIALNDKQEQLFTSFEEVNAISLQGIVSNMPYEKSVLIYKKEGKYGLINLEGKMITQPIYEEIQSLRNKESELLVRKDGKVGVINSKGATIIPIEYDDITGDGYYEDSVKYRLSGYIVTEKTQEGYRYGYLDWNRKKVLDTQYNDIYRMLEINDINNTYIIASKDGKVGVLKNGQVILNYEYQEIQYEEANEVFQVQKNTKCGVISITGKQILPVEYDEIQFCGIYMKAIEEGKETLFDREGKEIVDSKYTSMIKTENGPYYISIDQEGLYGVMKENGEILVANKYYYLEYLFDRYFIATKEDGKLGVISDEDASILRFEYDVLQKIEDCNMVEAKKLKENQSEIYSKEMKQIASMSDAIIYIYEDYVQAYSKEEIRYFSKDGTEKKNTEIFKENQLFAKKENDKWGFVDKSGKIVIECKYDRVTEFNSHGFAGIKLQDKWGVINEQGEVLVEPIYKILGENTDPEFIGKYYKVYFGYGESYFTDEIL